VSIGQEKIIKEKHKKEVGERIYFMQHLTKETIFKFKLRLTELQKSERRMHASTGTPEAAGLQGIAEGCRPQGKIGLEGFGQIWLNILIGSIQFLFMNRF